MVVPDGLENLVGEPERHDVLDGFLAQVVVDAEDRLRAERASDDLVEVSRAFQVMAEGLLDDDPAPMGRVVAGHAVALELAHHGLEGLRRDRQVEGMVASRSAFLVEFADRACQSLEGFVVVEFAANEPDSLEQLFPHLLAEGGTSVLGYRVMNDLGEVLVLPVASGESHQPEPWW